MNNLHLIADTFFLLRIPKCLAQNTHNALQDIPHKGLETLVLLFRKEYNSGILFSCLIQSCYVFQRTCIMLFCFLSVTFKDLPPSQKHKNWFLYQLTGAFKNIIWSKEVATKISHCDLLEIILHVLSKTESFYIFKLSKVQADPLLSLWDRWTLKCVDWNFADYCREQLPFFINIFTGGKFSLLFFFFERSLSLQSWNPLFCVK